MLNVRNQELNFLYWFWNYRNPSFDGSTDVDDEVALYAIESTNGLKGILVNAYGAYADTPFDAIIDKLYFHK